jgi:hypothetical protein
VSWASRQTEERTGQAWAPAPALFPLLEEDCDPAGGHHARGVTAPTHEKKANTRNVESRGTYYGRPGSGLRPESLSKVFPKYWTVDNVRATTGAGETIHTPNPAWLYLPRQGSKSFSRGRNSPSTLREHGHDLPHHGLFFDPRMLQNPEKFSMAPGKMMRGIPAKKQP